MYKLMAIVCGLLFFSTAASAQRFNAFVGYSYSRFGLYLPGVSVFPGSPPVRHSLNGWNGSFEAKVLPVLGIVADSSGHYGNETIDLGCSQYNVSFCGPRNGYVSLYSLTAGPQVSLRLGRFKPYAHALFGGALYRIAMPVVSQRSFADVLGGGVDVSVIPRIAWRVQADALQTRFPFLLSFTTSNNQNHSLRLSTGVVFRF
jgi:opacity protein-like surface antigen